ncbi:GIY-YIG nuclease family protein [Oceanidesulfovibrio marinus]|uniref:GIY-YIG nuclease family protein n=1 Tax=Oceanidesulfovibrio marinus TaxID=370038 RepID=A0ABX6NEX2_9BACT|nr:GIY-YIG nuclease family protein [Oceanidesulfovibrio marinus]QJT08300.1 GIY-YIG nuclease family protein [Oceanidesulfovibrio marinus]
MDNKARAFSIKIFLPQGDPEGLRIIEKSNWTGLGFAFNRATFEIARQRQEMAKTGVYVLVGSGESSSLPVIYVGEGDPIKPRLESHYAQKDFWNWAVFFVSKDGSLNKAHVKYLEHRLVDLASKAKQVSLDNGNSPQAPTLSEAELADCESFLEDMRSIFPLLGLSAFELPQVKPKSRHLLSINSKGVHAEGFEASQGFVVRKGSHAVVEEVPSIHQYGTSLRSDLVEKEVLSLEGNHYTFTQDYTFKSPSTAAIVVLGRSANGRTEWRDKNGKTLKEIQEETTRN